MWLSVFHFSIVLVFILFYFFKSESADGPDQNFLFLISLIFLSMRFHYFRLSWNLSPKSINTALQLLINSELYYDPKTELNSIFTNSVAILRNINDRSIYFLKSIKTGPFVI